MRPCSGALVMTIRWLDAAWWCCMRACATLSVLASKHAAAAQLGSLPELDRRGSPGVLSRCFCVCVCACAVWSLGVGRQMGLKAAMLMAGINLKN